MEDRRFVVQEGAYGVERLYNIGTEHYGDHHGGFLNFGWWENAPDYITAAHDLVHKMAGLLGVTGDSAVLDVACGMGSQDVYLHSQYGCSIDAVDILWKHVQIARRRIEAAGIGQKVRAHHGTATKLPFPDQSFTHVMCIEGSQHFNTREDFLKEAFRLMKPEGVMVLADFCITHPARNLREKTVVKAAQKLWACPDANVYGIEAYLRKLSQLGFVNATITEVGRYTIPGYFKEKKKIVNIREMSEIRGLFLTLCGLVVDYSVYKSYKDRLTEYILVRAEKPT